MKKITWHDRFVNFKGLSQEMGSGFEFAMVSKRLEITSPFMYCKDYIQDAYQGRIHKTSRCVYGFSYDPKETAQPHLDKVRLLITNAGDPKFREKTINCLDFIHQIEDKLGIPKTIFTECENPPKKYARCGVQYVEGSKRWIMSPPMISMYTLLLRIGCGHNIGDTYEQTFDKIVLKDEKTYTSIDKTRLKNSIDGIRKIILIGDQRIFGRLIKENYPLVDCYTMHNSMGIVAFTSKATENHVPKWHKMVAKHEKELLK